MEFNGSNGKQGCFYQSKLQGSGSVITNAHVDSNYADIITNIGIAHSNSNACANPDSHRNAAT